MSDEKPLHRDFRTLVYLFIGLRLILLIVFQPQILETDDSDVPVVERGLTYLGDFHEHYEFASRINADNMPYRDYWVEFPPVFIGLSALVEALTPDFTAWASIMFLVMLVFDTGNLILMYRLAERIYDKDTAFALAAVYALLAAPIIMLAWNFEVMVSFSILAGLWFFSDYANPGRTGHARHVAPRRNWAHLIQTPSPRKHLMSAAVIAPGIMTKYIPVLILPMVWRFSERKTALIYTAVSLTLVLMALIPLVAWGGEMAITSLTVQFDKPSYQTVWALLDGNYGSGSFPGGDFRYDVHAAAVAQTGNAPVIPGWLRLIPFALLGLWIFRLPMQTDEKNMLAFFTVTVTLFMLWAQGWSPQWTVTLAPLILLNFPTRAGVLVVLALMFGAFIEYPLLFRYAADTENLISGAYRMPFALLIITRTVILSGITAALVQRLRTA